MHWRANEIPESIEQIESNVRSRVIGMAEQLVNEGEEKAQAMRDALERTRRMGEAQQAIGQVSPEREFHVIHTGGNWVLRADNAENGQTFDTKDEAVKQGIDKVEGINGNLYVHNAAGHFQEIYSYSDQGTTEMGPTGGTEGAQGGQSGQTHGQPGTSASGQMSLDTLEDLYLDQLQDLYSGEEQLIEAIPKLAGKAASAQLTEAFETHLEETRGHKEKLEQIFEGLSQTPGQETCEAMEGIIEEGEELIGKCNDEDTCDAGLIAAAQRAEHYEMAGYGSARTYAKRLGRAGDAEILDSILSEEKATDEKLTDIAESTINPRAES